MSGSQSAVKPALGPSEPLLDLPSRTRATVLQARDEKVKQGVDVVKLGVASPAAGQSDVAQSTAVIGPPGAGPSAASAKRDGSR
jgi:hypothetical protein